MSGISQFGLSIVIYMLHVIADNNIKFTVKTFHFLLCFPVPFLWAFFFPVLFSPNFWSASNYYPAFSLLDNILVILVIPVPSCDHFLSRSCLYLHHICLIFLLSPLMRSLFSGLCFHFWSLSFASSRVLWNSHELPTVDAPDFLSTSSISLILVYTYTHL